MKLSSSFFANSNYIPKIQRRPITLFQRLHLWEINMIMMNI